MWICRCDCGTRHTVTQDALRSGNTQSCGCLHREVISQGVDLVGERFGRLLVLAPAPRKSYPRGHPHRMWLCECACGKRIIVSQERLRNGNTQSCKCLQREMISRRATTHGQSRPGRKYFREYYVWASTKARCYNPNSAAFSNYGGRGITMAPRWRRSFSTFLTDMGPCPPGLTLDRIDNDGPYTPGNCRWATREEQGRNKRSNRLIHFQGQTLCAADWAELLGVRLMTLIYRLRMGWPVVRALQEPVRRDRRSARK
jgi:hypothetical protein